MKNFQLEPGNISQHQGHLIGGISGAMTNIATSGDVYGLQVAGANARALIIPQLCISAWCTEAFATGQALAFGVWKVTGFTAIHDTGTGIKTIASKRKFTGAGNALSGINVRISGTDAISNATYAPIDEDEPLIVAAGAVSTTPSCSGVWTPGPGALPIALAPDEGLIIRPLVAIANDGTVSLFVGVDAQRD